MVIEKKGTLILGCIYLPILFESRKPDVKANETSYF